MSFEIINSLRGKWASERYSQMKGQQFGDVEVIGFAEEGPYSKRLLVRCKCGNEYPITEKYLRKRHETRCQRCSQILKNRGREGYLEFLDTGDFWINRKTPDNFIKKLKPDKED